MKKGLLIAMCLLMIVTQGKVLNIYAWNTEFQDRFNAYFADKVPEDVTVNWIITPNADNAYQNKLDEALLAQESADPDDRIDIFLVEADYALKYVDTPYTMDVMGDLIRFQRCSERCFLAGMSRWFYLPTLHR